MVVTGLLWAGCDSSRVSSPGTGTGTEGGSSTGSSAGTSGDGVCPDGENWQDGDPSVVFADGRLADYALTLDAADWEELKASARDEEYVAARLTAAGCDVGSVGLRFKGSVGTLDNCFDDQGNQTCPKLSMKVKFNHVDDTVRYHGLKRLNFHSLRHDPSLMHDRLGYAMFRDMGIDVPRASHATLQVNGESLGVFSLVEAG